MGKNTDTLKLLAQRLQSKGALNILSALSRHFFHGAGINLMSDLAWVARRLDPGPPRFSIVAIETMSGCNYRCTFCPIGKIKMPTGQMSLDLFEKILSQLRYFQGSIHLFLFNEPLLDPRIVEFCRLANQNTSAQIVIQTNGSQLTKERAEALTKYAVIIVNDYTQNNAILQRVRPYQIEKNLILVDRDANETLTNRAGNVPGRPVVHLSQFCVRPFSQIYISHDGRVVLCCQDWGFESVMGDVNVNTLEEIWNNEKYHAVRRQLLKRQRVGLCSKCDFPGV